VREREREKREIERKSARDWVCFVVGYDGDEFQMVGWWWCVPSLVPSTSQEKEVEKRKGWEGASQKEESVWWREEVLRERRRRVGECVSEERRRRVGECVSEERRRGVGECVSEERRRRVGECFSEERRRRVGECVSEERRRVGEVLRGEEVGECVSRLCEVSPPHLSMSNQQGDM
jgi:hypothetical protein